MVLVELGSSGRGAGCDVGGGDTRWVRPLYVQRHGSIGCLAGDKPDPAPLWRDLKPSRASTSSRFGVTGGAVGRVASNQSCGLMPICCISLAVDRTSSLKKASNWSTVIGIGSLPVLAMRS